MKPPKRFVRIFARAAKTILVGLNASQQSLNVSQLMRISNTNFSLTILAMYFLYNKGWISNSSAKWSWVGAAVDRDAYFITAIGKQQL